MRRSFPKWCGRSAGPLRERATRKQCCRPADLRFSNSSHFTSSSSVGGPIYSLDAAGGRLSRQFRCSYLTASMAGAGTSKSARPLLFGPGHIQTHTRRLIALRILGPHVYGRRAASSGRRRRGGSMLFDSQARGRKELFWLAFRGLAGRLWLGVGGSLWCHTSLKKRRRRMETTSVCRYAEVINRGRLWCGLPHPAETSVL